MSFEEPVRIHTLVGATLLALLGSSCSGSGDPAPGPSPPPLAWTTDPGNPIIESAWSGLGDLLINDPCVLFDVGAYHMWYSKGKGVGINHVKIYKATSADGLTWTHDPAVLLGPDSRITVSGSTAPATAGVYELIGEEAIDFTNGRPAYRIPGVELYLWYDPTNLHYRLSDVLGADGTSSWLGSAGTIADGSFTPLTGSASGTATATSDWDSEKIETPMVVRVQGIYHLYYSGFKVGDLPGRYMLGHATSLDGVSWTKDPANPVIAAGVDANEWGFYQAAEPGVVFNPTDSTFYVYYTTAKNRGDGYTGNLNLMQGIAVATSTDGSAFAFQQMALVQSAHYPVTQNYVGYSTPFALIDADGEFQLFYDVAQYPHLDDWRQVAIARAASADGLTFSEVQTDIFVYQDVPWRTQEVRAPCVLEENDRFRMWFAGHNELIFQPGFKFGIGYAVSGPVR